MSLTSYRAAPPRGSDDGCQWTEDRLCSGSVVGEEGSMFALPARWFVCCFLSSDFWPLLSGLCRPGGDLLSHALRRSTIGAEGFHGRVRDGIGCGPLARATRPTKARGRMSVDRSQMTEGFLTLMSGSDGSTIWILFFGLCSSAGWDRETGV